MQRNGVRGNILRRSVLCHTLAGRECDLLTITDFQSDEADIRARRAVIITGRVHPGATPASWIVRGMLDFLTGHSPGARLLRKIFVFKVVPMLNPDGVFYGNNRCSLAGVDLNRQWQLPSPHRHPTINHAKALIRSMQASSEVSLGGSSSSHDGIAATLRGHGLRDHRTPTPNAKP